MGIPWEALARVYPVHDVGNGSLRVPVETAGHQRSQTVCLSYHPEGALGVVRVTSRALTRSQAFDGLAPMLYSKRTSTAEAEEAEIPATLPAWLELLEHNDRVRDVSLRVAGDWLEVTQDVVLLGEVPVAQLVQSVARVARVADGLEMRLRGGDEL